MKSRIEERRESLGLTQEDLARIVGVAKSTVSRWESGGIMEIKQKRLPSLARTLNTSVSYLLGLTEDPEPQPMLTKADLQIYQEMFKSDLFHELLYTAGFQETVDGDANVTIYNDEYIINETPELKEQVTKMVLSYFTFLLKQEGTPRKK